MGGRRTGGVIDSPGEVFWVSSYERSYGESSGWKCKHVIWGGANGSCAAVEGGYGY